MCKLSLELINLLSESFDEEKVKEKVMKKKIQGDKIKDDTKNAMDKETEKAGLANHLDYSLDGFSEKVSYLRI